MACFHPLTAWRAPPGRDFPGGKSITFDHRFSVGCEELKLPCGQCIGCRLAKSRDWAMRCVHEASLYEQNCFITLTYDNAHLPKDGSLNVDDIQKFFKRLRKRFGAGIRFLQCGEYGSEFQRPHHHACIFNFDFPDKIPISCAGGNMLYISESLSDLWPFGYHTIGALTYDTAAYVARYVTKKITGSIADDHYKGRKPEFITMSRRPGLAHDWYEKYKKDLYPKDFVTLNHGVKLKPAKYYDRMFDKEYPEAFEKLKEKRKNELELRALEYTEDRLKVKEQLLKLNFKEKMQRKFERDG